jgi:hypothetical protein
VLLAGPALAAGDEVPYVQSAAGVVDTMLSVARVGPGDFVVDLGSGDGRIVITAAKRYGARGMGIEYDPKLVEESRASADREGVSDRVSFLREDIFDADFSRASVVTMYLLPDVNVQLRSRLLYELMPGTRVVSHDFDMAEWEPERSVTVPVPDKTVGPRKESTIYLWTVPARVAGHWRGTLTGPQGEEPVLIEFEQLFQKVRATLWLRRSTLGGSGSLQGRAISLALRRSDTFGAQPLQFSLTVADGRLQGEATDGEHHFVLYATRLIN